MGERLCMNCMKHTANTVCDNCGYNNAIAFENVIGLKAETLLHDRYLVGRILGQGGFGITYVGFDTLLNIKVAIKEYFPTGTVSRDNGVSNQLRWPTSQVQGDTWKQGCDNFLKEARRMAKVDGIPSIVRVRDTFFENNTAYIIMDFVEGITLKIHLHQKGIMGISQCVKIMRPLLIGLSALHKLNIIHRDISPDNIIIQPNGSLKLLDLGAAKDMEATMNSASLSQRVTKKGFSPPEQYMEHGHIGSWTDVYSITATIYYCITGRNMPDAMDRVMNDPLSFNVPTVEPLSNQLINILSKGMAVRHEDRIQTIDELLNQLNMALNAAEQGRNVNPPKPAVGKKANMPVSGKTMPQKTKAAAPVSKPPAVKSGKKSKLAIVIAACVFALATAIIIPIAVLKGRDKSDDASTQEKVTNENNSEDVNERIPAGTYKISAMNLEGQLYTYANLKELGYGNVAMRVNKENIYFRENDGEEESVYNYEMHNGEGRIWDDEEEFTIYYSNDTITLDFASAKDYSGGTPYTMDFVKQEETSNAEGEEKNTSVVGEYSICEMYIDDTLYTLSNLMDLGYDEFKLRVTEDVIYFQKSAESSEVAYEYTLENGEGKMWSDSEEYTIYYENDKLIIDLASSEDFAKYSNYLMKFSRD